MAEATLERVRPPEQPPVPTVAKPSDPRAPTTSDSDRSGAAGSFSQWRRTARSVERWLMALGVLLALITGAIVGVDDNRILGLIVAVAIVVLVFEYPPFAAWILVAGTPYVVGVPRDLYFPILRINEIFLLIVVFALVVRWIIKSRQLTFKINRFEVATIGFVFFGSVMPIVLSYGRLRPLGIDDIFYSITLWKFLAVYTIVRIVIRTPQQVRELLWASLLAACGIAVMAVLDSRNIGDFAFSLANYFPPGQNLINDGRGAATIGNPIGLGGYMAVHAFIAFAMLLKGEQPRPLLYLVTFSTVVGTIGSGQTSGLIALVAGVVGFAIVTKSIGKILIYGIPMMLVVSAMLYPVIEARVVGLSNDGIVTSYERDGIESLPGKDQPFALYVTNPGSSWDVRQFNLRSHFLPRFESINDWLWGVSPQARVPLPTVGGNTEFIWIESGHLWLFWIGGLPLFVAFIAWMFYGGRAMWHRSRTLDGPVGVAAIAAFSSFCALFVVQTFDPHITLRGTADIFWPLLALAMVGASTIEWVPERGNRVIAVGSGSAYSRLVREDATITQRREALQRLQPSPVTRFAKRAFDIVGSALGLVVLSIPLLLVMAVIRLTSRGPAIFTQQRVGIREKPFTIYKLRTMTVDNDDREHREFVTEQLLNPDATADTGDGAFKLEDSRVTKVGSILRRLSFDELPQLFNVLKGDMSLIGPRPALAWEVELFDEQYRMRSLVKPGCTGLWQVSGRNKLSSLQMLDLDLDYTRNVSVFRDLGILLKTPLVLLRGDGAR